MPAVFWSKPSKTEAVRLRKEIRKNQRAAREKLRSILLTRKMSNAEIRKGVGLTRDQLLARDGFDAVDQALRAFAHLNATFEPKER